MAHRAVIWIWLVGVLAVGLLVEGCRKDEQNRPLMYHKGTYQGQPDQPLSDQTVEQLRQRAAGQRI